MVQLFSVGSDVHELEVRRIYDNGRYLSFYRAYISTEDVKLSEEIMEASLIMAAKHSEQTLKMDSFQLKSFIVVLTEYQLERFERLRKKDGRPMKPLKPFTVNKALGNDPDQNERGTRLQRLSLRDIAILSLHTINNLKFDDIAELFSTKIKLIIKRFRRANTSLNTESASIEDRLNSSNKMQPQTSRLVYELMQQKILHLERAMNTNNHLLSAEAEARVQEKMKNTSSGFSLANIPRGAIFAILAIVLLLVILIFTRIFATSDIKEGDELELTSGSESLGHQAGLPTEDDVEESIQTFTTTTVVPEGLYASYTKTTVFIDPDTLILFDLTEGQTPQEVYDLAEIAESHWGVQYVGKIEDTIYLAFIDGTGGIIEGVPASLEETRYWQSYWFENQSPLKQELKSGIVIDEVQYQFDSTEVENDN